MNTSIQPSIGGLSFNNFTFPYLSFTFYLCWEGAHPPLRARPGKVLSQAIPYIISISGM